MSNSNKKKKQWKEEKDRLLKMTPEERSKRKLEKTPVSIKEIPSWMDEAKRKTSENDENPEQQRRSLSEKVSLYNGDITLLEVDAIVNAANSSLLGGGGVDGCIHRASGPYLLAECRTLGGCQTGQAKITCGFDLPAKYVIHTVGPIARGQINEHHNKALGSCYNSSLELAKENKIRSIAFPCISTGIYGFPNEPAANIALTTVKEWLKKNQDAMDRIIFCAFLEVDVKIYEKKMNEVFPTDDDDDDNKDEDNDEEEENVQDNKDTDKISDGQAIKETESDDKHNEKSDEEEQDSSPVTSEEGTVLPKENISVEKNEDTADEEMGSQTEESQGLIRDSSNDGDTQMESQDVLQSPEVDANVETITNKSEDDVKETIQEDKESADLKALSDDEMNSQVESIMDSQDG